MQPRQTPFVPDCAGRPLMIVGNYGSGKTEVAVHVAALAAAGGGPVSIVDLDLVNPYFRCREARGWMEERGVRVVVPPPRLEWADLPIVLPEVPALLHPAPGAHAVFDVGGDDVGARALASLRCSLGASPYELWQVINARRPFTDSVGGCLRMLESIEAASRLEVTGLVANTHLLQDTTAGIVLEGYELARDVARRSGLPLRCVTAPVGLELEPIDAPLLRLERVMLPPWTKGEPLGSHRD